VRKLFFARARFALLLPDALPISDAMRMRSDLGVLCHRMLARSDAGDFMAEA
jgi:hypothetical protein